MANNDDYFTVPNQNNGQGPPNNNNNKGFGGNGGRNGGMPDNGFGGNGGYGGGGNAFGGNGYGGGGNGYGGNGAPMNFGNNGGFGANNNGFGGGGFPSNNGPGNNSNPPSGNVRGPRLQICLPPGTFVGYDPFDHPDDHLPIEDSFKQPVCKVDDKGHIIFGNLATNDHPPPPVEAEEVKVIDVAKSGFIEAEFYHGLLPREDINLLLKTNGDFLVRTTEIAGNGNRQFCLSVKAGNGNVEHFVIRVVNNKFMLTEDGAFPSINELINHYMKKKVSFGNPPVILRRPMCRQDWEFHPEVVHLDKAIGEGAFGQVFIGKVTLTKGQPQVDCAVKTMKLQLMDKKMIEEIMKEARLMRMLKHKNIVRCFGVSADQEPLMIIMEFVQDGSLDKYLRTKTVAINIEERIQMSYDAACGINHIHKMGILHRDIAARNCLYGKKVLKISDFGLSRQATVLRTDPGEKVPLRGLSPEVFSTQVFTPAADIWAYGVLVWEIFCNGAEPYTGWTVAQVKSEIVTKNYRLSLPAWAPDFMKENLAGTFKTDPAERIKLITVIQSIEKHKRRKQSMMQQKKSFASPVVKSPSKMNEANNAAVITAPPTVAPTAAITTVGNVSNISSNISDMKNTTKKKTAPKKGVFGKLGLKKKKGAAGPSKEGPDKKLSKEVNFKASTEKYSKEKYSKEKLSREKRG